MQNIVHPTYGDGDVDLYDFVLFEHSIATGS